MKVKTIKDFLSIGTKLGLNKGLLASYSDVYFTNDYIYVFGLEHHIRLKHYEIIEREFSIDFNEFLDLIKNLKPTDNFEITHDSILINKKYQYSITTNSFKELPRVIAFIEGNRFLFAADFYRSLSNFCDPKSDVFNHILFRNEYCFASDSRIVAWLNNYTGQNFLISCKMINAIPKGIHSSVLQFCYSDEHSSILKYSFGETCIYEYSQFVEYPKIEKVIPLSIFGNELPKNNFDIIVSLKLITEIINAALPCSSNGTILLNFIKNDTRIDATFSSCDIDKNKSFSKTFSFATNHKEDKLNFTEIRFNGNTILKCLKEQKEPIVKITFTNQNNIILLSNQTAFMPINS